MSRFQVLSDEQGSMIAGLLPKPTGRRGRPFADAHLVVEGITGVGVGSRGVICRRSLAAD